MQISEMKKPVGQVKVYNLLNRFKLPDPDRQKSTTPFRERDTMVLDGARTHSHKYIYIYNTHCIQDDAATAYTPNFIQHQRV